MLLSIDPKKIEKQLAENPPAYIITPFNLEPVEIFHELPEASVYTVTPARLSGPKPEPKEKLFGTHLRELKETIKSLTE